jgi:nicotinic acetylcholine receptor
MFRLLPLLLLNTASPSSANNASLVNSLRRHLLTDLDPKVAPSTPDGGLETKVQFRIFKVISVDVSSGALVLKVWRRVRWFDERLAWDPENFGGLGTVLVYPTGGHASLDDNLWLPHIVVYNALKAETAMFETGAAWVRSDGHVHWSVPGTIEITCRFSGRARSWLRVRVP